MIVCNDMNCLGTIPNEANEQESYTFGDESEGLSLPSKIYTFSRKKERNTLKISLLLTRITPNSLSNIYIYILTLIEREASEKRR